MSPKELIINYKATLLNRSTVKWNHTTNGHVKHTLVKLQKSQQKTLATLKGESPHKMAHKSYRFVWQLFSGLDSSAESWKPHLYFTTIPNMINYVHMDTCFAGEWLALHFDPLFAGYLPNQKQRRRNEQNLTKTNRIWVWRYVGKTKVVSTISALRLGGPWTSQQIRFTKVW